MAEAVIVGTMKGDFEAELMKFSSSLSAKFLNELARFLMSCKSASAEDRTSSHPLEINDKAFSAVDDVVLVSGGLKFIIALLQKLGMKKMGGWKLNGYFIALVG